MQTILGATGQIAIELAKELALRYTRDLRLVSRRPQKVNQSAELKPADLLNAEQTRAAIQGSEIVYFTAGLPPDTELWETQFPVMLGNALEATRRAGAKFVYFDNTYMYPQDARVLTEEAPFEPVGRKGAVRAEMARMVLQEVARGEIPVLIARAPEFYGPGKTQSFTNALIIDRIKAGRRPFIPVNANKQRTLIWTPDASRALALLGNTPDAYGQTWHLPCCDDRPTYKAFVSMAQEVFGTRTRPWIVGRQALMMAGLLSPKVREIQELLPRYAHHSLFDSTKFKTRFPEFEVTSYREGLELLRSK